LSAGYRPDLAAREVRFAYERYGYLKAEVSEKTVAVPEDQAHRYDIVVRVVNEASNISPAIQHSLPARPSAQ